MTPDGLSTLDDLKKKDSGEVKVHDFAKNKVILGRKWATDNESVHLLRFWRIANVARGTYSPIAMISGTSEIKTELFAKPEWAYSTCVLDVKAFELCSECSGQNYCKIVDRGCSGVINCLLKLSMMSKEGRWKQIQEGDDLKTTIRRSVDWLISYSRNRNLMWTV